MDAVELILEENGDREKYELICDIGQYQMEGLAFGRLNDQISDEQTLKVLAFTKDLLVRMVSELAIVQNTDLALQGDQPIGKTSAKSLKGCPS